MVLILPFITAILTIFALCDGLFFHADQLFNFWNIEQNGVIFKKQQFEVEAYFVIEFRLRLVTNDMGCVSRRNY